MSLEKAPTVKLTCGIDMPVLGLGCWTPSGDGTFDPSPEKLTAAIDEALDAGYRLFDTALVYNTEEILGKALQKNFEEGVVKRGDVFIITKLPGTYMSREGVFLAVERSLKNLQLQYIDLYLIHGPWCSKRTGDNINLFAEPLSSFQRANFEEIWKAMEELVTAGKIRAIGVSNLNSKQIDRIRAVARLPVSNLQVECHAYLQQEKLREFCKQHNIVLTAYSPIGAPGRPDFLKSQDDTNMLEEEVLVNLAKTYKKTPAQILLRWNIQRGVAVIPKSITPSRIRENFQVFDFILSDKDMNAIKALDKNKRYFVFPDSLGLHPDDHLKDN